MADKYVNRSNVHYISFDEIVDAINSGVVDIYDIVYTTDTHENIIVAPDYSLVSIKSKIYRFIDVQSAETFLNEATDTYEGQIVSIIYGSDYAGYIVNRNIYGKYYVSPLNAYNGQVNYDTLGNRPIINMTGKLGEPIIIGNLTTGQYKVDGLYMIGGDLETINVSVNSNLFLVEKQADYTYIKKISATDITDYVIDKDGKVTTAVVPTTEWLKAQGYVTESYVDAKVAALDFITKEEIEEYVSNVVLQNIDNAVNTRIDQIIDERFQTVTEKEALDAFVQIFK